MKLFASASLLILMCACGKVTSSTDAGDDVDASDPIDSAPPGPMLNAIDPPAGIVTAEVTLTGIRFGASQGGSAVQFAGVAATVVSWSDTQIVASVPDVMPAEVPVTVTVDGSESNPRPFRVVLPPMVYLNNDATDTTTGFSSVTAVSFEPSTGTLTQQGAPVPTNQTGAGYGGCSGAASLHEGTRRLFATGITGVTVFNIDPVTGELTMVAGSPFATGSTYAEAMAINAAGTRLFVASYNDGAGTVAVFNVAANGALTAVSGSPFATVNSLDHVMLSHNEQFLYVNAEDGTFVGFSVAASGALTPLSGSPFSTGTFAFGIAGRPGADQMVIPDSTPRLNVYALNPASGAPPPIGGSPFAVTAPASGTFHFPAFTPDGDRLYVSWDNSGFLSGFSMAADGTPAPLGGSPYDFTASSGDFACLAVSRDGSYLLANDEAGNTVSVFTFDGGGTPVQVGGSPFAQTTPTTGASGMALTF